MSISRIFSKFSTSLLNLYIVSIESELFAAFNMFLLTEWHIRFHCLILDFRKRSKLLIFLVFENLLLRLKWYIIKAYRNYILQKHILIIYRKNISQLYIAKKYRNYISEKHIAITYRKNISWKRITKTYHKKISRKRIVKIYTLIDYQLMI